MQLSSFFDENKNSIVAMIFDSLVSPDSGQAAMVRANEATVQLTKYLTNYGYPIPSLYWGTENDLILLIEDLGDEILAHTLIGDKAQNYSSQQIFSYYREASQLILQLQRIL